MTKKNKTMQQENIAIEKTKLWVKEWVIRLNLCPFAKVPFAADRIRFVVFEGTDMEKFIQMIGEELQLLEKAPPSEIETTLLIHPDLLTDFLDYNDFQEVCDEILEDLELDGEIQIATFHPDYQFEGTRPKSAENYTNRSPYPMLHFLREASVEKAQNLYLNISEIPDNNIRKLKEMGTTEILKQLENIYT